MRIVVCVKPVPLTVELDRTTTRVDRTGPVGLAAVDEHAIETALRIRDSSEGAEVVLLALTAATAFDSLRPGLAMGADRAVVIAGPEFEGSDLLGTSLALAEAARALAPDLLVFGASSSDGNGAMLWAAVAARLDLPVVSRAISAEVAHGRLTATRQMEFGLDVVEADLPAVLAISGEIAAPRYPSFRDVIGAKKKTVEVLELGSGIDVPAERVGAAGSRTTVLGIRATPPRGTRTIIHDEGDAHVQLAAFLRERRLL
jgi:electron transfer flavoprotein beta subunit